MVYAGVHPRRTSGHFAWTEEWRAPEYKAAFPFGYTELERYAPNSRPGRETPREDQVQSVAVVRQDRGWTVLAMWDRSGDCRHGSNSAFFAPGHLTGEEVLALARELFPEVVARIERAAPIRIIQ
jgi:hypothetical protein